MAGPLVNRGRRSPGSGRRRGSGLVAEINVTPFVDVMLVLLVIFMITAPLLTSTVPVDLPQTQAARATGQDEPLVVSVNNSGKVYLQDSEMELDVLVVRLRAITNNNTDARIFVRGDRAINYGRVLEVMGAISAAGFNKVALVAEVPQGRPAQGQQRR
ncbi:MAG: protein TolR [Azospirillum sp.]|nr:protein TolR [Azospirillum sp.]